MSDFMEILRTLRNQSLPLDQLEWQSEDGNLTLHRETAHDHSGDWFRLGKQDGSHVYQDGSHVYLNPCELEQLRRKLNELHLNKGDDDDSTIS